MNTSILTIDERSNIESGSWFSKLSLPLRQAILSRATVRRLADGATLSARGTPAEDWCGVARGAVRVSSVSLAGKQVTLTYVEPGTWFGDIALFDGLPRTHDANAHGETTLLVVRKADFRELLTQHVELYDALLRLNCRRAVRGSEPRRRSRYRASWTRAVDRSIPFTRTIRPTPSRSRLS